MPNLKPFVFAKGDETTAIVGQMIVDRLFPDVPRIDIPISVEQRIATDDKCIAEFAKAFQQHGAAVKMSTASKDPRILKLGLGSANILLRELCEVLGLWRMVYHPKNYRGPVAVFRYGSGGFYDEVEYRIELQDGVEYGYSTTRMNLSNIEPFVKIAAQLAKEHNLRVKVCSKHTIADSEAEFNKRVLEALRSHGFVDDSILTDVAVATQATDKTGHVLYIMDNPNGDTGSDVVDWVDGSRTMGSRLYCKNGLYYEELPGGTAPDKMDTDLTGDNFFNPLGAFLSISAAVTTANPDLSAYVSQLTMAGLQYDLDTPEGEKSTHEMIRLMAEAK